MFWVNNEKFNLYAQQIFPFEISKRKKHSYIFQFIYSHLTRYYKSNMHYRYINHTFH